MTTSAESQDPFGVPVHASINFPSPESTSAPAPALVLDPYAPTAWGQTAEDFVCPSGQRCRVKKAQIQQLLQMGILDSVNSLSGVVDLEVIAKAQGLPPIDQIKELSKNQDKMNALFEVIDKAVCYAVEMPKLWPVPAEGEERVVGRVYIDSVDLRDRIAIFEKVFGAISAMKPFRQGSS